MNDWKTQLKADPLPWLLEPDEANPDVRTFALRDLLDRPVDDVSVGEAVCYFPGAQARLHAAVLVTHAEEVSERLDAAAESSGGTFVNAVFSGEEVAEIDIATVEVVVGQSPS